MKSISVLLFCVSFFIHSQAQIEFSFSRLRYSDSAIVYRGLDNPIEIKNFNIDTIKHEVKAVIGTMTRWKEGTLFFYRYGDLKLSTDTIIILENGIEIERKPIEVRKIPNATIFLVGRKSELKISRRILLAAPYFVVIYPGFLWNAYDVVRRIHIRALCNEQTQEFHVSGNRIPQELLEEIQNSKSKIVLDCDVTYYGIGCGITQSFHCEIF